MLHFFCLLFHAVFAVAVAIVFNTSPSEIFCETVKGRDPHTYRHNDEGLLAVLELPFDNDLLTKCGISSCDHYKCWSFQLYHYKDQTLPNGAWRCLLYNHAHDLADFDNDGRKQTGFEITDIYAYNRRRSFRYNPTSAIFLTPRPSPREFTPGTPIDEVGTPPKHIQRARFAIIEAPSSVSPRSRSNTDPQSYASTSSSRPDSHQYSGLDYESYQSDNESSSFQSPQKSDIPTHLINEERLGKPHYHSSSISGSQKSHVQATLTSQISRSAYESYVANLKASSLPESLLSAVTKVRFSLPHFMSMKVDLTKDVELTNPVKPVDHSIPGKSPISKKVYKTRTKARVLLPQFMSMKIDATKNVQLTNPVEPVDHSTPGKSPIPTRFHKSKKSRLPEKIITRHHTNSPENEEFSRNSQQSEPRNPEEGTRPQIKLTRRKGIFYSDDGPTGDV
ncbi:hypothetical protein NEOLI_001432 [Neolecta irregularis DAH-3]|uniref:Apple domain-containing protein n=1 Tax=Neolecta irregularis (strain DAH-3) TaxID=1198029 RepID=A0A1U7LGD8_NEOID|nr:hypothetical protein NEOLI_001432 [Neolecta irregularis DAH-3]|eukprot:OLL21663.1 hypothetical protein NEOLI_001432 [Neolecta irregularis DAH-3]